MTHLEVPRNLLSFPRIAATEAAKLQQAEAAKNGNKDNGATSAGGSAGAAHAAGMGLFSPPPSGSHQQLKSPQNDQNSKAVFKKK